jgi:probable addiction module antidote protein
MKEMTMTQRIKVADLPEFDAALYLDSEAAIAAYLTDILEANDSALLASALGDIARARGMSEIAKASGLTREALYKALRPNAKPRYDTIAKVCGALGVRLVAQAIHAGVSKVKGITRPSNGRPKSTAAAHLYGKR